MYRLNRYLLSAAGLQQAIPLPGLSEREWRHLVQAAAEHRLIPDVWQSLHPAMALPPAVREELQRAAAVSAARSLFFQAELNRAAVALTNANVDFSPLKGVALAHRLYGDATARQCGDLDLLVSPSQVDAGLKALAGIGYQLAQEFDPNKQHHASLVRQTGLSATTLELHVGIKVDKAPWFPERWWKERVHVPGLGEQIRIFRDDHLLIYLCLHAARHGFEAWGWLLDIAVLIRKVGWAPPDWDRFVAETKLTGFPGVVYLALRLLQQLGCRDVPREVLKALRPAHDRSPLVFFLLTRRSLGSTRTHRLITALAIPTRGALPSLARFHAEHGYRSALLAATVYTGKLLRHGLAATAEMIVSIWPRLKRG